MISKETGVKIAKGLAVIITPTIILLIVLAFLYWRKQRNKKQIKEAIEASNANTITPESENVKKE